MIFQRGIDRVNQELNDDRLMRAGQNQARAGFREQIVGHFVKPVVVEFLGALSAP